ncbi:hypothetical protein ACJX0J_029813 [Zea mays]
MAQHIKTTIPYLPHELHLQPILTIIKKLQTLELLSCLTIIKKLQTLDLTIIKKLQTLDIILIEKLQTLEAQFLSKFNNRIIYGIQIEIKKLQTLELLSWYMHANMDGIQIEIEKLQTLEAQFLSKFNNRIIYGIQIEIKKLQTLELLSWSNKLLEYGIQIEIKKLQTLELLSCLAIIKKITHSRVAELFAQDGIQIEIKKITHSRVAELVNNLNIDGIQIEIKKVQTLELLSCLALRASEKPWPGVTGGQGSSPKFLTQGFYCDNIVLKHMDPFPWQDFIFITWELYIVIISS